VIRKATLEDINSIMQIVQETIFEMKSYNNTQWDENYPLESNFIDDINKGELYVVDEDGDVGGFACINKVEPEEYKDLTWKLDTAALVIHRMAVNPKFRRKGIGTKLISFADELALEQNIKLLKTDTYSLNTKMQGLFEKCGYTFVEEINFLKKERPFYCYDKSINNEH
jgi:GNAT superfamily N-acetyltransferase